MGDDASDQVTRVTDVQQVARMGNLGSSECLVVVYGNNIGRKYDLIDDVVTIGRDTENTIVLDSDAVSRRHARIERLLDSRFIIDLGSTNGTYINDQQVKTRAKLRSGVLIKMGDTIFKYLAGDDLETAYFEEICKMMVTDGLTQVANKRALDDFLEREFARAKRHGRALSLLMLDLDHFKKINDLHGHLTGDFVLKEVTGVIKRRIRREELFARYGGEEFVIVLPETNRDQARALAESIRRLVEALIINFEGIQVRVTVSIGVCQFDPLRHSSPMELIKEADKNLYVAKQRGRNRVYG